MSFASRVRGALPLRVQPFARYHYERWRGLLERELPMFCELVNPGDRVIDVGANYGIYVHALRRRGAIVEAFEPQPTCADVLRAYAAVDSAVRLHEVALGRRDGTAELEVPIVGGKAARGSASLAHSVSGHPGFGDGLQLSRSDDPGVERILVKVRPLDAFGFTGIRAIKIDVEGAELEVIAGATETLARCRPALLIEIEQRHHSDSIDRVFETMEALGYSGSFLVPGSGFRPTCEFQPEVHQQLASCGRRHSLYINNFLFRPHAA